MGSTTLTANAIKSRKYKHGVFFDPKTFKPEVYSTQYGIDYLNSDSLISPISNIRDDWFKPDTEIFVRSNDDSKMISGGTCEYKDLLKIRDNTQTHYLNGDIFTPDTEVFISSLKEIDTEWRCVIVQGKVLAYSQYRPVISSDVPNEVRYFAARMAAKWGPHEIYVMDICQTPDFGLKVLECNCFNGSGFYKCDMDTIVHTVSRYQETR